MKITEIEKVSGVQPFSVEQVKKILNLTNPKGELDQFTVNYVEDRGQHFVVLTDQSGQISAYAGFVQRPNNIWQARNAQSFAPYTGQALVGKIYNMVNQVWRHRLMSDLRQSEDSVKLWSKTLPGLGLKPMMMDVQTSMIDKPDLNKLYPDNELEQGNYCWILDPSNRYPDQNLVESGYTLIMPLMGIWFTGGSYN
jgi:hypothetical protein